MLEPDGHLFATGCFNWIPNLSVGNWLEINKRPFTTGCSGFQVCFILHIRHVTVLNFTPISWGDDPQFPLAHIFQFWAVQPKTSFSDRPFSIPFLRDRSLRSTKIIERPRHHQQDLINSMLSRDPTKRPGTLEPKSWGGNRWRAELDSVGKLWKVSGNPKSLTIWRIHRNDKISCDGHCFLGHVNCVCVCFLLVYFCPFFFSRLCCFFFVKAQVCFFQKFVESTSQSVRAVRAESRIHLRNGYNRKKYPGTTGNMSDFYKSS